jgi:hypothetical protein
MTDRYDVTSNFASCPAATGEPRPTSERTHRCTCGVEWTSLVGSVGTLLETVMKPAESLLVKLISEYVDETVHRSHYGAFERVEIGADGCGCRITEEVTANGSSVDGTQRTEHRMGCWNGQHHNADSVRPTGVQGGDWINDETGLRRSADAGLCSCSAMEQPHIRGRFTLCPARGMPDGSGRPIAIDARPGYDEAAAGLAHDSTVEP